MESALIVSSIEKSASIISDTLKKTSCKNITIAKTCGEARRMAQSHNYDIFIINSPVQNEAGDALAMEFVSYGISQVLFIVKNDIYEYMASKVEDAGVLTISKPVNRDSLWTAFKLANATNARLKTLQKNNLKLTKKIQDINIINRAKCLLISHLNMDEEGAHKHIEKNAMDMRLSRKEVAENILKTYE